MPTNQHSVGLDGLRGFAAFGVVLFHMNCWLHIPGLATNAYLAVDLFFCLSGYVLPLAYGLESSPRLDFVSFAQTRLIRLMPMIVLATGVSALEILVQSRITANSEFFAPLLHAVVFGLLVLPYFSAPHSIGGPQLFPLNGPQYTLFFELVVNAAWFACRRVAQLPLALALFVISLVLLITYGSGGDTPSTFWHGFPRVFTSYFAGVAVHQLSRGCGKALAQSFATTLVFRVATISMGTLFLYPWTVGFPLQIAWVVVVAPLLIVTGAHVVIEGSVRDLCFALGVLSYPIYALHRPIILWVRLCVEAAAGRPLPQIEVPLALVTIIAFSWFALRIFDEPARARLRRHLNRQPATTAATSALPTTA